MTTITTTKIQQENNKVWTEKEASFHFNKVYNQGITLLLLLLLLRKGIL